MTFENDPYSAKPATELDLLQAQKKIMDLVARREHSEKEIREKLSDRCPPEILEQALSWTRAQSWFTQPDELKQQIAAKLSTRGKGIHQINEKLKELGLDTIETDLDGEVTKARKLALGKWPADAFHGLDSQRAQKLKIKIARFLASRGFDADIVSSILKNEFKAGALSHDEEY